MIGIAIQFTTCNLESKIISKVKIKNGLSIFFFFYFEFTFDHSMMAICA